MHTCVRMSVCVSMLVDLSIWVSVRIYPSAPVLIVTLLLISTLAKQLMKSILYTNPKPAIPDIDGTVDHRNPA